MTQQEFITYLQKKRKCSINFTWIIKIQNDKINI